MSASTPARRGLWAPFAEREFTLVWVGLMTSYLGDVIQGHAVAWLVADRSRSGSELGLLAAVQTLPRLLLAPVAGALLDRTDRRALLLAAQAAAMAQAVALALLIRHGALTFGRLVTLSIALGACDAITLTARASLGPSLVRRDRVAGAVAVQALGINAVSVVGPVLSGLIVAGAGVEVCAWVNVATFVASIAAVAAMRELPPVARGEFGAQMREGWTFVRSERRLWRSIALAFVLGTFGMSSWKLLPLYARALLGVGAAGYGALAVASGLGAICASVLVTARSNEGGLARVIRRSAFGFSAAIGLLAVARNYASAVVGLAVLGFAQMAFRSAVTMTVHAATPERLRGRVSALLAVELSTWSLGAALVGRVVDATANLWSPPDTAAGLSLTLVALSLICASATAALARGHE